MVELAIVIPLIATVFLIGYNMLFLTHKSFASVNRSFTIAEELRTFQININKEANSAKKSEETAGRDALRRISATEIYIYADVDNTDGKNIPDIVRYYMQGGNLLRAVMRGTGTEYPYSYSGTFGTASTVLTNVVNTDIFSAQEPVRIVPEGSQEAPDHRVKLKMKLVIRGEPNNVEVESYLISKSRTEAE